MDEAILSRIWWCLVISKAQYRLSPSLGNFESKKVGLEKKVVIRMLQERIQYRLSPSLFCSFKLENVDQKMWRISSDVVEGKKLRGDDFSAWTPARRE